MLYNKRVGIFILSHPNSKYDITELQHHINEVLRNMETLEKIKTSLEILCRNSYSEIDVRLSNLFAKTLFMPLYQRKLDSLLSHHTYWTDGSLRKRNLRLIKFVFMQMLALINDLMDAEKRIDLRRSELRELNITASHLLAHQRALDLGLDYYLILEDDSLPRLTTQESTLFFQQLLAFLEHLGECSTQPLYCDLSAAYSFEALGIMGEEYSTAFCSCGLTIPADLFVRMILAPITNTNSASFFNRTFTNYIVPRLKFLQRRSYLRTFPIDLLLNLVFAQNASPKVRVYFSTRKIFEQKSLIV